MRRSYYYSEYAFIWWGRALNSCIGRIANMHLNTTWVALQYVSLLPSIIRKYSVPWASILALFLQSFTLRAHYSWASGICRQSAMLFPNKLLSYDTFPLKQMSLYPMVLWYITWATRCLNIRQTIQTVSWHRMGDMRKLLSPEMIQALM